MINSWQSTCIQEPFPPIHTNTQFIRRTNILSNSLFNMFKLPTKISHHHHRHILRRTAPPGTRILSTTHAPAQPKTPKSILEANSYREIPSKDDVNPTSKENTQSGTHDEIAHTNEAAYGPNTNPVEERAMAATEVSSFNSIVSNSE